MAGVDCTYISTTSFSISGIDYTAECMFGRRLLCDCSPSGEKAVTINTSSWSDPLTTVNLIAADSEDLNSSLSSFRFGPGVDTLGSVSARGLHHNKLSNIDGGNETASYHLSASEYSDFESLTDNSIADTLHRHSELVAPDGSPDPALSVDAAGNVILHGNQYFFSPTVGSYASMEFGYGMTGNRNVYIDFIGDDTYSDYGLRIIRNATGANANTDIKHRGTGNFNLYAQDAGQILFTTSNVVRMTIEAAGNIGIRTTPGAGIELDVTGDIHCTGKLSSDGGNDPPYVLYNNETRQAIIDRIKLEVPTNKLNGAVMFYNGDTNKMELYHPDTGIFTDITGEHQLTIVAPTTETYGSKLKYYLDKNVGEIKTVEIRAESKDYDFAEDCEVDSETGKLYKRFEYESDGDNHKKGDIYKVEITKEKAIKKVKR